MGIRSTVASMIGGEAIDSRVREMVEQVLATKGYARPADVQHLKDRVEALEQGGAPAAPAADVEVSALETEVANLRKKLNMAMGAIQAATAQLADVRRSSDEARADARQALARAESALATAESLSDGVEALEEAVASDDGDERIDLNSASAEDLEGLSGIGPSMARRIVADRKENGRYHKVADLSRVKGLGEATVKRLASSLRV